MQFPNHIAKYNSKEIFTPNDWERTRKHGKNTKFPEKYILSYFDYSKNYFLRKHKTKKIKVHQWLIVHITEDIGFVQIPGGGASSAAAIVEELIALGGKYFMNTGTAGGLQTNGIVLCTKALRDEGTSHHYNKGKYSEPDKWLAGQLERLLKEKFIQYVKGPSWTIDAIYRETKAELERYKREGIYTVDMEASAIFTVAKFRKVKAASLFAVSDVLGKKGLAKFHRFDTRKGQRIVTDAAYDTLRRIR